MVMTAAPSAWPMPLCPPGFRCVLLVFDVRRCAPFEVAYWVRLPRVSDVEPCGAVPTYPSCQRLCFNRAQVLQRPQVFNKPLCGRARHCHGICTGAGVLAAHGACKNYFAGSKLCLHSPATWEATLSLYSAALRN